MLVVVAAAAVAVAVAGEEEEVVVVVVCLLKRPKRNGHGKSIQGQGYDPTFSSVLPNAIMFILKSIIVLSIL
jgi:preprotein translocase subunit SecG